MTQAFGPERSRRLAARIAARQEAHALRRDDDLPPLFVAAAERETARQRGDLAGMRHWRMVYDLLKGRRLS